MIMTPPKDMPQPYYGTTLVDPIRGVEVTEFDLACLLAEGWEIAAGSDELMTAVRAATKTKKDEE